MRIIVIGCGSIGTALALAADRLPEVKNVYLFDTKPEASKLVSSVMAKGTVIDSVEEELYHADMVIEAASQDAAREYLPKIGRASCRERV